METLLQSRRRIRYKMPRKPKSAVRKQAPSLPTMQNINKHKKRKLEDTELGRNSRSHQKRWKGAAAKATNESDYFSLAKPEVRLDGGPQIEFGSVDCLPD